MIGVYPYFILLYFLVYRDPSIGFITIPNILGSIIHYNHQPTEVLNTARVGTIAGLFFATFLNATVQLVLLVIAMVTSTQFEYFLTHLLLF